jgi:16S rRNA (guanine527-N7)-methyltransferase
MPINETAQTIVNKAVEQFSLAGGAPLARYLSEIFAWNSAIGLVSRKDPAGACERLLFESIELSQLLNLDHTVRVADIGSGAGFPGLVWALMHPRMEMALIERREKRALFLERTSKALGADNVTVLARDLKDVSRETSRLGVFGLVTTVAVGDPADIAPAVEPVLMNEARFASTVAREAQVPLRVGASLMLERRVEGKFGCYVIYRRGV